MKSIADFKQKYAGKRAFLIGNGPSLARTPLDRLCGEYTFAMNRIALLYQKLQWRPSFFVCTTTNVTKPTWREDIHTTLKLGCPAFIWDKLMEHVAGFENTLPINCTHGEFIVPEALDEWWSDDCAQRVCKFGTSMLVALQLAAYMGFSQIYLLGCDLGFKPDPTQRKQSEQGATDPNHFHPDYGTPGCSADQLNMNMRAAHELALRAGKRLGVQIFNATLGGELEIYPRADFHMLTRAAA
ncbi:MAG TPA: hypothetical protein VHS31_20355 [Tepidisphaeraceae bacterium]|nr:hypothetical protein [Tepidisphaeraceae bacterium]